MNYHDLRALFVKRFAIPKERTLESALKRFTIAEKAVFYFFAGLFILSAILLLSGVNSIFLVDVPLRGGALTEGVLGNPRFINPVLAISESDSDLTKLVYSGLVRLTPKGELVNDLADSVTSSNDGLVYTAYLKPNITFHDGAPITADDVIFTIEKIQDASLKSPLFGNFSGVTVAEVDNHTISFTLKKPYEPFLENLTVGILPKHIWANVTDDEFSFSQFNSLPIGSGPYKISSVERDSGGIPNYYALAPFDKDATGEPFVASLVFKFYSSENALLDAYSGGDIDTLSGLSADEANALAKRGARVLAMPLPRVFGVFFNQSQAPVLHDQTVREALNLAAPREEIVGTVLKGYGSALDGPLPESLFPWVTEHTATSSYQTRLAEAEALLADAGWKKNASTGILEKKTKSATMTLSFSISTSDTPELKSAAELVRDSWQKIGAHVDLEVFDAGDLNQERHPSATLRRSPLRRSGRKRCRCLPILALVREK
jgi:peptide/nickel transport system substrate-binding protein